MHAVEEGGGSEDQNERVREEILNLRRCWELASVLDFIDVRYSIFYFIFFGYSFVLRDILFLLGYDS
jgi:hypothetical protein